MKKARARTSTGQSILVVSLLLVGCAAGARRSEPPNMGAVETPARRTEPASPAVDADQTPSAPPTVIDVEHPPPQTDPTPSAPAAAQPGDDAIRDRAFAHYRVKVWAWLNVRLASALRSARVPCVAERRLAFQVSLKSRRTSALPRLTHYRRAGTRRSIEPSTACYRGLLASAFRRPRRVFRRSLQPRSIILL